MVNRVAVVVVGDIGRSPRMQYHTLSLANQAHCDVDLIGFEGEACWPEITSNSRIHVHAIPQNKTPKFLEKAWILGKLYKAFAQFWVFFWLLLNIPRPDFILVQTPPAVPILFIVHIISFFRKSKLIIDWHNYGYTILEVSQNNRKSISVYCYKIFEKFFGKGANWNFCVSNAMKEDLEKNWGIKAIAVHDKPPSLFKKSSVEKSHELFLKYKFGTDNESINSSKTAFTEYVSKNIQFRPDRPALLVSSTSWTKDEDFDILLDALVALDSIPKIPNIRVVVTGKGDMRSHYETLITEKKLKKIKIFTEFLPYKDYVTLLGSSDIGVCLHTSSSGVDLPMKVVDMFGCGLPVCAVKYPALPELVRHEKNGLVFQGHKELAAALCELLTEFPNSKKLTKMRQEIEKSQKETWDKNWEEKVLPIFR